MKKLTLIVLMLSGILFLFGSCKKETAYKLDIDAMGNITSISYSINGAVAGTVYKSGEFDANEGDDILITLTPSGPAGTAWFFEVYGYKYAHGKKDSDYTIWEVGGSGATNHTTISFTLPH